MAFALSGSIALGEPGPSALACANTDLSLDERMAVFSSHGWKEKIDAKSRILRGAMLLGNIDATKQDTWDGTSEWVDELVSLSSRDEALAFSYRKDAVLLGKNSAGQDTCIYASNKPSLAQLSVAFPEIGIFQNGLRRFASFDRNNLRFTASEFPEVASTGLLETCNNYVFSASFVIRQADS